MLNATAPESTQLDFVIYVFSYNRGIFLDNCLKSIEDCAAGIPVTVIDDQSDDPNTVAVLNKYKHTLNIIKAGEAEISEHKTGGLYNNMRFAFRDARQSGKRLVLFLQDDMQLVRPILPGDLEAAIAFFENNRNAAELHTCFMKRFFADTDERLTKLDRSGEAYLRSPDYPGFSGFSAVGLFDVERFDHLFGGLQQGEYANNEYAQRCGIQMGISTRPFMMWLPYPISHRGKTRNIPLQIVESVAGCGFYPYQIMTDDEVTQLLDRRPEQRPYAEDWLDCGPLNKAPVWSFAGGLSNLKARGGLRGWLGYKLYRLRHGK